MTADRERDRQTSRDGGDGATMDTCVVAIDDRERWERLLDPLPHGFAHTWDSCHAHTLTTGYATSLVHVEADGARVACPVAERRIGPHVDVVTPFGFSGFVGTDPCPVLPARWHALMRERGYVCGYFACNPLYGHGSYVEAAEVYPNTEIYVLDLKKSSEELWRRLSRNRRRELRDWRPASHDGDRIEMTEFLLTHYHPFMRARNATPQYDFTTATLAALVSSPKVFLLGARVEGRLAAVRVVGHTPYGADDLFFVHLPGAARHNTGLIWSAVHRLREMGVRTYTLGGGVRPGDSIARSKERFGAARLELRGAKQIYDAATYEALCREQGKDSEDRSGYFPPYRAPSRPA